MKQNRIKPLILLALIAFTFFNCDKDLFEAPNTENLDQVTSTFGYVSGEDVPEVLNSITSITGFTPLDRGSLNRGLSNNKAYIDTELILMAMDEDAMTNYSFSITVEQSPMNEFYNLILNKDANGKKLKEIEEG